MRDATYNTEPTQSLEAGVPDGIPEEMLETEVRPTRAQFLTMLVNLANPELDTVQSKSFPRCSGERILRASGELGKGKRNHKWHGGRRTGAGHIADTE